MLEAAGGPNEVTLAQLRTGMTSGTAVLDIEATGVDRDSGAGIVMALGAVDAVDLAVADRNGAPTVENAVSDRTYAPGAAAVNIDLKDVFDDPDDDTLTYEAAAPVPGGDQMSPDAPLWAARGSFVAFFASPDFNNPAQPDADGGVEALVVVDPGRVARTSRRAVLSQWPSRRKNRARWDADGCIFLIAGRLKRKSRVQ